MDREELARLAALVRDAPGLRGKRDLDLVQTFGAAVNGDDAAVLDPGPAAAAVDEDVTAAPRIVVGGEAIAPSLVRADPHAAGAAAVVTNVSDVRAMGGRPLGIVDMLVSPDREHARAVLEGLSWAAGLLGVPVVGGHLTLGQPPALSAVCTGVVRRPLRAAAARPGDALVVACATEGRYLDDDGRFFSSLRDRDPARLRSDGDALVEVAERGLAHAARDVSMPGVAGSLLQLLELAGCGATLDVRALPRPAGVPRDRWLLTFPSFGFVLAAPVERAPATVAAFTDRGLAAAVCGRFEDGRTLRLSDGAAVAPVWDLATTPLTRPGPVGGPRA